MTKPKTSPGPGHNSDQTAADPSTSQIGGITAEALRQFIERIERLDEEATALNADRKEVYDQAKGQGFDTKIIRKLVALRRKDAEAMEEEAQLVQLYAAAIGMQLPLNL